jgi:CheY-like chemotaxis protein
MATNILVVDDDRLNRQLISKVLRQEGYQVVEACDGALALEILQMLRFDLVITDFVMPKLNGIEFVEQIHTLQPRTPIIFITGFGSVISGEAILQEVTEVLPKPFELGVLRINCPCLTQHHSDVA